MPLSKEQAKQRLQRIVNLGVAVFYPQFVPARYSLVSARVIPDTECRNRDYQLKFCDKNGLCFSIESLCAGLGDPPDGNRQLTGKSKLFGSFRINVFNPRSEGNDTKYRSYISEWLRDDKVVFAEKDGISLRRFHHFLGDGLTDQEAVAIVKSLMPLR